MRAWTASGRRAEALGSGLSASVLLLVLACSALALNPPTPLPRSSKKRARTVRMKAGKS